MNLLPNATSVLVIIGIALLLPLSMVIHPFDFSNILNDNNKALDYSHLAQAQSTQNSNLHAEQSIQSDASNIDDFTLLIYVVGSTLEDSSYEATNDINELLKSNTSNPKVNVVLQTGGSTGKPDKNRIIDFSTVQRHHLENNKLRNLTNLGVINMGTGDTLSNFLNWSITTYPAKKYGLIFWDHGASVQGFGNDVNFNGDALNLYEILVSLHQLKLTSKTFENFEFIGFDSCLMGTLEVGSYLNSAYPFSKFLIASEDIEPNWGWNYTTILDAIAINPKITGDILGKGIIQSYIDDSNRISQDRKFYANRDITLSVVNLTRLPELNKRLDQLVNATINQITGPDTVLKLLRSVDTTEKFGKSVTSSYGMIDLYDLLSKLSDSFPSLTDKIEQVKFEINASVIHNHSGEAHPNGNGISVYLPLSLSDLGIIDKLASSGYTVTNNINWLIFVNWIGSMIKTDHFSPVVQSERDGSSINVQVSDPDSQQVYVSHVLNSSKGKPILYIQNLDPNLINQTGYYKFEDKKMLVLCNENLCSPVSMTMDVMGDSKKIFIPVEIQSKFGNRQVSLVYELQNSSNSFFFLGGVDEFQVRGGQSIPKEKISLQRGDIIYPRGLNFIDQPYYIKETTTVKERIKNIFNSFVKDKSLTVLDPQNIQPRYINFNQSDVSLTFCDFSDFCDQTRKYQINSSLINSITPKVNEMNDMTHQDVQNRVVVFKSENASDNLTYVNRIHGFQLEYPDSWLSVTLDPGDSNIPKVYLGDPHVVSLFPIEEILSSNGSGLSLMNSISITMQDRKLKSPSIYFDYFNNPETKDDLRTEFEYELLNKSTLEINGHPAFEFILGSQKYIQPGFASSDPKRLQYWVTVSMGGKEFIINFEAEESKFYKYLPIVKRIVNSFAPLELPDMIRESNEVVDEENNISYIRELMASNLSKNIVYREYKDPKYNFTVSYPYIDRTSNPEAVEFDENNYLVVFQLPNTNYLDHPYKDPFLFISISNSDITSAETMLFGSQILNSTNTTLPDGSSMSVNERKYFLPLLYQWVYEKKATMPIGDRFISTSLIVPFENYAQYEPMFDIALGSLKP